VTEADFQAQVLELAESLGLVVLHVREPRREASAWTGFPDLIIIAPGGGIMFRELKMPGKQLRAAQRDWADILSGQNHGMWKPADLHSGRIRAELEDLAGRELRAAGPPTAQDRLWRALTAAAARQETTSA
jgi:hypothetical protein